MLLAAVRFLVDLDQGGAAASVQARASVNRSQSTAMPSSLRVIVVCAALVTWLPAQAQFLGFGLETNVELTKQDIDIIRHTVNEQVHQAGRHYR